MIKYEDRDEYRIFKVIPSMEKDVQDRKVYYDTSTKTLTIHLRYKYDNITAGASFTEGLSRFEMWQEEQAKKLYVTTMTRAGEITTEKCAWQLSIPVKTDVPISFGGSEVNICHYAKDEIEAEKKALLTIFHELRDLIVKNQNNS